MKFAVCECGAKILIVPDLQQMRLAIDRHAARHVEDEGNSKKARAEQSRIETELAKKVIAAIIGMDTPGQVVEGPASCVFPEVTYNQN